MAVISLTCPRCGAPVQMPYGRNMCYCEFCGSPVEKEMSDSEFSAMSKNKEFYDAVRAAIHCVNNKDYATALEFADKAAALNDTDPAPFMIKYVCYLDKDYKKATSFVGIGRSMHKAKASEALSEDDYRSLLYAYVRNYLSDRDEDLKRMYKTYKKVKPDDIHNVRQYEKLKRISSFFTDPELKDAFMDECESFLAECKNKVDAIPTGTTQSNWDALCEIRNDRLFLAAGTLFVDPKFAAPATEFVNKYRTILYQKWETPLKKGEVSSSKDQLNLYRYEADSLLSWFRTVR